MKWNTFDVIHVLQCEWKRSFPSVTIWLRMSLDVIGMIAFDSFYWFQVNMLPMVSPWGRETGLQCLLKEMHWSNKKLSSPLIKLNPWTGNDDIRYYFMMLLVIHVSHYSLMLLVCCPVVGLFIVMYCWHSFCCNSLHLTEAQLVTQLSAQEQGCAYCVRVGTPLSMRLIYSACCNVITKGQLSGWESGNWRILWAAF